MPGSHLVHRWAAAALAALSCALLAASAAGADAGPYPMFGISVDRVINDDFWGTRWDERLSAVHAVGIGVARTDAFWDWSEPVPPRAGGHRWDWRIADAVERALTAHGLRWLPVLDYSTAWSTSVPGDTHAPPAADGDYAAYAAAFAARFGRYGSFWRDNPSLDYSPVTTYEIWNEEDAAWAWKPRPDPARYIGMYLEARAAIKAVDPQATVLIGGLAPDAGYEKAMLEARPDAVGQIDGVALHPYAATAQAVLAAVRAQRLTLDRLGLTGVPLWITEVGWATRGGGAEALAPEPQRAAYMAQVTDTLARSDCGIAAVVPYTWSTPEADPAKGEDWYGMAHPDGSLTPTARAYAGVVARWGNDPPVAGTGRIPICYPRRPAGLAAVALRGELRDAWAPLAR